MLKKICINDLLYDIVIVWKSCWATKFTRQDRRKRMEPGGGGTSDTDDFILCLRQ